METIRSYYHTPTPEEQLGSLYMTWSGYRECLPTHCIGPRILPYYKLTLIVKGSGFFQHGGEMLPLGEGDAFVLFPQVKHHYYANPKDPWTLKWVCFNGQQCAGLVAQLGAAPENPFLHGRMTGKTVESLDRIIDAMGAGESQSLCAMGNFYLLFHELIRLGEGLPGGLRKATEKEAVIQKVMTYVQLNYADDMKVEHICRHVSYSRSYLSRSFKKQTGISLSDYVNQVRISSAQKLLLDTGLKVREIANSVGFHDESYFTKRFRAFTGLSPREYRLKRKFD
ncbi:MAG: AraC family transcriptional regulator [Christensenellales bacterium]|jgi:AraC family transcriptional regulator of arabinose operon